MLNNLNFYQSLTINNNLAISEDKSGSMIYV